MLELLLASILAAAVTVAEGGLFFQPALSPDGTKVAFAADEDGLVSIYVAPTAGAGERVRIAVIGQGANAHRLAARTLLHRPWSPDGTRLLYVAPSNDPRYERLYTVNAEGRDPIPVGPPGIIASAGWVNDTRIVYALRESRGDDKQRIVASDLASPSGEPAEQMAYSKSVVADLAPSPDGRYVAILHLSGELDARKRELRILDLKSGRETRLPHTDNANFLTWSRDSQRLFYLDAKSGELPFWAVGEEGTNPPLAMGMEAIVALENHLVGADRKGIVSAIGLEDGLQKPLAADHVPVSSGATKVAFIRRGPKGSAIVIAEVTREGVEAGDIGLPKPPPPEPPAEKPAEKPPTAPPSTGGGVPGNGSGG